jgi:hypothetical protein
VFCAGWRCAYGAFYVLQVNVLVAGFAYLMAVLVIAAQWDLFESSVTSIAAMLYLNFFHQGDTTGCIECRALSDFFFHC